ncbi:MAG: hypothetical protein ABJ356_08795, partial [Balneola sp.]
ILLLGYSNANACSCASSWQETNNHYITSDFVGKVTINQVFDSPTKESKSFKIEVKTEKVFKGNKVRTLYVYGNRGHDILTSCDVYVEKGEEWIVPYSDKPKTNFQHVFAVFYYYDEEDESRFLSSFEL